MTDSIATYALLGLLLAGFAGSKFGAQAAKLGPPAFCGVGMYFISTGMMNLWRLGDGIYGQIKWWQSGLFMVVVLYVLARYFLSRQESVTIFLLAVGSVTLAWLASNVEVEKLAEAALIFCIVAACWAIFSDIPRRDLIGRLVWGVLAIAETGGAVEYLDCQILHGFHNARIEGSSCGQLYGWWAPFLQPAITAPVILYLVWRFFKPRRE